MGAFLRPTEIAVLMDYSERSAYSVIQRLNAELRKKGAYTCAGRVSTLYFCERFHLDPAVFGIGSEERGEIDDV